MVWVVTQSTPQTSLHFIRHTPSCPGHPTWKLACKCVQLCSGGRLNTAGPPAKGCNRPAKVRSLGIVRLARTGDARSGGHGRTRGNGLQTVARGQYSGGAGLVAEVPGGRKPKIDSRWLLLKRSVIGLPTSGCYSGGQ